MFTRQHAIAIAGVLRERVGKMDKDEHAALVQKFATLLYYHNPRMDVKRFTKAVYEHLHP